MFFCCIKTPLAFPGALKISQSSSPVAEQTLCVSASLTLVHSFMMLELLHLDNTNNMHRYPCFSAGLQGLARGTWDLFGGLFIF